MSSRIFQSVIVQMKDATKRPVGVVDYSGVVVASNDLSLIGSTVWTKPDLHEEPGEKTIRSKGRTYKTFGGSGTRFDYAVFAEGEDDLAKTICIMAYIAITEARMYFEENHDKCAFVKNIISDNILPGDIYVHAKELNFDMDAMRVVLVIKYSEVFDLSAVELLQSLFPDKSDFVISVGERDIAVIKELPALSDSQYVYKLAGLLKQKIYDELGVNTVIGISTLSRNIKELADKYKEAVVAIEVGKVFDAEKTIISYESLGIGRLIYQLPTTLCEIFLSEVFKKNPIEALDQETLFTIDKFFENSLNVSETSRKLFVHRNTLVYRLEKIKKITGLDLREFDHAIVFKVALMVKKYLVSQQSKY